MFVKVYKRCCPALYWTMPLHAVTVFMWTTRQQPESELERQPKSLAYNTAAVCSSSCDEISHGLSILARAHTLHPLYQVEMSRWILCTAR